MSPRSSAKTRELERNTMDVDGTRSVVPPIYPSTTYARAHDHSLPNLGGRDLCYARPDNPSVRAAEETLCDLEGGADCALFSSGMAALHAALEGSMRACVQSTARDDVFVAAPTCAYFAVRFRILEWCASRNIEVVSYDPDLPFSVYGLDPSTEEVREESEAKARRSGYAGKSLRTVLREQRDVGRRAMMVWIESPANPGWDHVDIQSAVDAARRCDAFCVCVDATVTTPIIMNPLALGADLVMHSATKYLNGHGDVVAGALVTRVEDETWRCVTHERKLGGATLGAFDAYLLSRGMRTLELRVKRQSTTAIWLANAMKEFIDKVREDTGVEAGVVLYPGLVPGFAKQCKEHDVDDECTPDGSTKRTYHGGMMSLCFYDFLGSKTDEKKVRVERLVTFCRMFATSCTIWTCATSLGGFESLIEHRYSVEEPGSMDPFIPFGLLRLSVGLEDRRELLKDLKSAFWRALDHMRKQEGVNVDSLRSLDK